jgi:hypothetical protein
LVLSSIVKKGYLFSFFFWLDLAALVSILFDIYYLLDAISVTFKIPTDATGVARAGRAGKAGTRVGRLLKIVRMIRVFRVAKLYKEAKKAIDTRKVVMKNAEANNKVHPLDKSKIKMKSQSQKRLK